MKQIRFNGSGEEYFKIWIVNVLLCILTLGIYYPWAKVRTRRYFYANTEYTDRYFDYHATGKQLFLGYLIGVAILFVLQIIGSIFPLAGVILPIVLFTIIPWIVWRSLKFNMRMTSFSNVRFSFVGNLKSSYLIYMLIPVLGYIAFGLIIAAVVAIAQTLIGNTAGAESTTPIIIISVLGMLAAIAVGVYFVGLFTKRASEYQISQTKFGQGRFLTDIRTRKFVEITFKAALIGIASTLSVVVFLGLILFAITPGEFSFENIMASLSYTVESSLFSVAVVIAYISFIAASLFSAAYSYSRQRQYLYANTTLDKAITFKSTVTTKGYFFVLLTNMLLTIFTLGLGLPWAKVRVARYIAENTWIEASNIDMNRYLTQKEQEQSAIGEEVGDVLDIDIDIAI